MKKVLGLLAVVGSMFAGSAMAQNNSNGFGPGNGAVINSYLDLDCFAHITFADPDLTDFQVIYVSGGTPAVAGAPGANYNNVLTPKIFTLESGCPVTVTATNGLNNAVSGEFVHETIQDKIIPGAAISIQGETIPYDTQLHGGSTSTFNNPAMELTVDVSLPATPAAVAALPAGRYEMAITLTITENP